MIQCWFRFVQEEFCQQGIMGWTEVFLIAAGLAQVVLTAPKPDQVSGTATVGVSRTVLTRF